MLPWKDQNALRKSIRWRWMREAEMNRRRARERARSAQEDADGSGLSGRSARPAAQARKEAQGSGEA